MMLGMLSFDTASAQPIVQDDFESGVLSSSWLSNNGITSGVSIEYGGGAEGTTNYATLAATSGQLGTRFDVAEPGGATNFYVDLYFRIQSTAQRQFNLQFSTSTSSIGSGNTAVNLRYQTNQWSAYDYLSGAWQSINGLGSVSAGSWYHLLFTGTNWGQVSASYSIALSAAGGTNFTSSASHLTWSQDDSITANLERYFELSAVYGNCPGFDVDQISVVGDGSTQATPIWNTLDTTPTPIAGSALNLSFLNEMPAGQHGFITTDTNGDLYFSDEPGQTIRFYGANICLNMLEPSQAQSKAIANRMAAMGYNVVRLMGFEQLATYFNGIFNPVTSTNAGALTFNTAELAQFDYLIYALKQKGIYVQIDMFGLNVTTVPQLAPYASSSGTINPLLPCVPEAYGLWQQEVQMLLTHTNPFTSLALKDDPVMVGFSPWNEALLLNFNGFSLSYSNLMLGEVNAFCASNNLPALTAFPTAGLSSAPGPEQSILLQFYAQQTLGVYARMKYFLTNDLHVRVPLGGFNDLEGPAVDYWRSQGPDVFENHSYYQGFNNQTGAFHQGGPYAYNPATDFSDSDVFSSTSPSQVSGSYPALALQQNWGQPFYLTEFNDDFPDPGHEEAGLFTGAVGAFQGWDMIDRFNFGELTADDAALNFKVGAYDSYRVNVDPLMIMSDGIGSLMFRNHAVRRAAPRLTFVWDTAFCRTNPSAQYANVGLDNLFYLSYLYVSQTVYASEPGQTFPLIYRDLTRAEITNGVATGNFPAAKLINVPKVTTMSASTLKAAAQACISALINSGDASEAGVGLIQQTNLNQNKLASETGELTFDLNTRTFLVNTPCAIAAAGTLSGLTQTFSQSQASLASSETKEGTVSAFSLDGQPLTNSTRMLVINTTDAQGYGATNITNPSTGIVNYSTPNANVAPTPSTPNQVLYATGNFTFTTTLNPADFIAYPLTMNGNRLSPLPIAYIGNQVSVNFYTSSGYAFEIIYSTNVPACVPTGLAIINAPTNGQMVLTWNLALGAISYNVKCSTNSGGPYFTLASGVTGNSYTNSGLINGQAYYYVVSGVNAGGIESSNSSQVGGTLTTALIIDNADASGVVIAGNWSASTSAPGYYGINYLQDGNAGGGLSVTFTPTIVASGYYDVYAWWTAGGNRATDVPIDVNNAQGTTTMAVNQQSNGSMWFYLGRFQFNAGANGNVIIRDDGANGYVVADAVQFVPVNRPQLAAGMISGPSGTQNMISWTGGGTLQTADQVQGPYSTITNNVNPLIVPPSGNRFFRVIQ